MSTCIHEYKCSLKASGENHENKIKTKVNEKNILQVLEFALKKNTLRHSILAASGVRGYIAGLRQKTRTRAGDPK
jgi:hypothetical protein